MVNEYLIPAAASQTELVEKRSRFIGQVWHIETEEAVRERIEQTKKQYHDARHNCWCYVLKSGVVRYSDDGEPQGTAGQPMLNVFQREGIVDVCCVVTRYFGGILLGAGGLVRAYTQCAKDALDAAGISVVRRLVEVAVTCSYSQFDLVKLESAQCQAVIADTDYGAEVTLVALLPEEAVATYLQRLTQVSAGTIVPQITGERFEGVVWKVSKI